MINVSFVIFKTPVSDIVDPVTKSIKMFVMHVFQMIL